MHLTATIDILDSYNTTPQFAHLKCNYVGDVTMILPKVDWTPENHRRIIMSLTDLKK